MCNQCYFDMLMYGEAVRHEPVVWEKGRFAAEPAKDAPKKARTAKTPPAGKPDAPDEAKED